MQTWFDAQLDQKILDGIYLADNLVKKEEIKKVDPFKRIAVHTALQQTHTVFSLLPEN